MSLYFTDTANKHEGYSPTIGSPGGEAEKILVQALIDCLKGGDS